MTHEEIRARIDALRKEFKIAVCDRQNEIQAEIQELIPQLSKVDRKIEKMKAKEKSTKLDGSLHSQKYKTRQTSNASNIRARLCFRA